MRSHIGRMAMAFGLVAAGLAFVSDAAAQSAQCLRLVNELTALDSGGGFNAPSPRFQQYDRAVRDQEAQIAKTRRAAQMNGCGTLFGRGREICTRIDSSLQQMQGNLSELRRTRDQLSGPSGGVTAARRQAILSEMGRQGCQRRELGSPLHAQREQPRRLSLLEQIFGVRTYREDGRRGGFDIDPDTGLTSRYGTFRTLCVRKCDGYYFPISFSTVQDRFMQDDMTCQSMCPGTDVELYFHGMPGQESEDMISYRSGEPYANLSTAFNYRKEVDPACTCRFAMAGLEEIAGSGNIYEDGAEEKPEAEPVIPLPIFRIDAGLDPESVSNTEGGLLSSNIDKLSGKPEPAPQNRPVAYGDGRIRVVGPEFFPVQ